MAEIHVERRHGSEGAQRFVVHVREGDSRTEYDVTVSAHDLDRLGATYGTAEDFIRACFGFLLEREPRGSILSSFDISVIGGYFPEFERVIAREG